MKRIEVCPLDAVPISAQAANFSASASAAELDSAGLIRKSDILRTIATLGHDYRFSRRGLDSEEPVLWGQFETVMLRPGLVLHRTRVRDLHDMQTSLTLAPGLKIGLVLEGETDFSFGSLDLRLGPRCDSRGRVHNPGTIVALAEADTFRRRWRRGRNEVKVSVTLQPRHRAIRAARSV